MVVVIFTGESTTRGITGSSVGKEDGGTAKELEEWQRIGLEGCWWDCVWQVMPSKRDPELHASALRLVLCETIAATLGTSDRQPSRKTLTVITCH